MAFRLTRSSAWGAIYKAGYGPKGARVRSKAAFANKFAPFLDHDQVYAFRPAGQRGPARESQTLIVSYPYKEAIDRENFEVFQQAAQKLGLQIRKDEVVFRDNSAYRIVVADSGVDVEAAMEQLPIAL